MTRLLDWRRCRRVASATCALLVFLVPVSLRADKAETWKERFLTDAPRAWEEYRAFTDRLQGTVEVTIVNTGAVSTHSRLEFKRNLHCKMALVQSLLPGQPRGELHAFNPLYGFALTRRTGDAPWVLGDLQMGVFKSPFTDDWRVLRSCIVASGVELSELVNLPIFRVLRAGAVQQDGRELCRIDFETQGQPPGGNDPRGTLWLDPQRCWTLRHCTLHRHHPGSVESTVDREVRATSAKYPIPVRCEEKTHILYPQSGNKDGEWVDEFNLREVSPLPGDEEFTLSAFGLPEPMGVKPPERSRAWLWLLVAAAGLAALAVLFAGLKRRAAARTKAPPSVHRSVS